MGHGKEFGLYSNSKKLPNGGHSHGMPSVLCLEVVVLSALGLADYTQGWPERQEARSGLLTQHVVSHPMGYSMVTLSLLSCGFRRAFLEPKRGGHWSIL